MHNIKKCRICSGVDVEFLKEDKITFAEVWQAWESMLPFGDFELKNVYSIKVEEMIIASESQIYSHYTVGHVYSFGGRAALEATIRRKYRNVGDDVRIHMGNDTNFSVSCYPEKIRISCLHDRWYR